MSSGDSKKLFFASFLLFGAFGCSQPVNPTSSLGPTSTVNYDICRNSSFNLDKQTPQSFRGLISCLNGQSGSVQPYQDLVSKMSDEDLGVFLDVFNVYLHPNLGQSFDLLNRMNSRGISTNFYKNLSVLIDSKLIQKTLPLLKRATQTDKTLDPGVLDLAQILSELIDQNKLDPLLVASAKIFNGSSAWALAYLLNQSPAGAPNLDAVVDNLRSVATQAIQDNDMQSMLVLGGDLAFQTQLAALTDADLSDVGYMLEMVSADGKTKDRLQHLQDLKRLSNRPMHCFNDGKTQRYVSNLDDEFSQEFIRRRLLGKAALDQLVLVDLPIIMSAADKNCDVPVGLSEAFSLLPDLAKMGASKGMGAIHFLYSGTSPLFQRFIQNKNVVPAAPLVSAISLRGGVSYGLGMFKDLAPTEFKSVSNFLSELALPNIKKAEVKIWIQNNLSGDVRTKVQKIADSLTDPTLVDVIDAVSKTPELELPVRIAIASSPFTNIRRDHIEKMLLKLLASDAAPELKDVATALLSSWRNTSGGVGGITSALAESTTLATEKPIQNSIKTLLSDSDFVSRLANVFFKANDLPEFSKAIEFTGQIASSGELERLVRFIVEVFKYSDEKKLASEPSGNGYVTPPNPTYGSLTPARNPAGETPKGDYTYCGQISGDLFSADGKNIYAALKCAASDSQGAGLSQLADVLKTTGHLGDISGLLAKRLLGQNANALLDDLKEFANSGRLTEILKLVMIGNEDPYQIFKQMDPLLQTGMKSDRVDQAMVGVSALLASNSFSLAMPALIDVAASTEPKKFFSSDDNYKMPADQAIMWAQAKSQVPGISDANIQEAINEFLERGDKYLYQQKLFHPYTPGAMQNEIWGEFNDLLRTNPEEHTGDVEELIAALRDIAEWDRTGKLDVVGFLKWAVSSYTAVPFYIGEEDEPHLRFVTPLDQLDILVANSNFGVVSALPFGVEHMGTYFQIQIAESDDFTGTLKGLRTKMSWGQALMKVFSKERYNFFRNNLANFTVLEQMNERHYLIILQRLYQAFMKATPADDRENQDPTVNHMSMVHRPTAWPMFTRLVLPLKHVDSQGQLDIFVKSLLQVVRTFPKSDDAAARAMLINLVKRGTVRRSTIDQFLSGISGLPDGSPEFRTFKDVTYHLTFVLSKAIDRSLGAAEVMSGLSQNMNDRFMQWFFEDVRKLDRSLSLRYVTQLASITPEQAKNVRGMMSSISAPTSFGKTHMSALAAIPLNIIENDSDRLAKFRDALERYSADSRVVGLRPSEMLKELVQKYSATRLTLSQTLADPVDRKVVATIVTDLAKSGGFGDLAKALGDASGDGDFDNFLYIIDNYFSEGPSSHGRRLTPRLSSIRN